MDIEFGASSDPAPMRISHIDTPELHLDDVARQNTWVEGLRSLSGEAVDHGPIEVLDGEIVPDGALREAVPDGAPGLLRALCEAPETEPIAIELVDSQHEPLTGCDAVLFHADWLDEQITEQEWRRRRVARMTVDDVQPAGADRVPSSSSPLATR